jgi:molybdate transport system substrate-binding protein
MNITKKACAAAWRAWLACVLATCCLFTVQVGAAEPPAHTVLVFAAASLTDALEEVDRAFTDQTQVPVKASFAASSVLARQIESGAPAEVFLSADVEWMDYLEQRHLLAAGSRHDLLGNRLVLIAPADSTVRVSLGPHLNLSQALGTGRLAMGDPDSVPAGLYARAALEKLGVWSQVSSRVAPAENVRAALAFVARGEAPLGIVYRTDALAEKRVRIVDVFPESTHPPIKYPVALLTHSGPEAAQLIEFLRSARARQIFGRHGFQPLP